MFTKKLDLSAHFVIDNRFSELKYSELMLWFTKLKYFDDYMIKGDSDRDFVVEWYQGYEWEIITKV